MPLTYRPDIDGLRTIAVFSVVLFHLGVPWVPGGFVGVDIFFVISGYLITALLEKDHGQGGISFATFYARRAKRLLPAGFAVFLFALAVGWFLYGTEDYSELALSVAAASVFFANFHFADRTDYFDAPAQDHPLLHTWSLSVEEQFYFVWPLLLIVLLRYRHKPVILFGVPAALFIASLASSIWMTAQSPGAAFFYLPSRFWELLLGAVLALYRHRVNLSAPLASLSGMTGLALIIFSIVTISEHDPFPGAIALLPCFGTALLILSGLGPASLTSRLLSTRVMVWGGLISYSLYLWHWPFIVFWRQSQNVQALDLPAMAGLLVASIITATLSYRYVEQPIRRLSAARLPNKRALKLAGASTLAIGLTGLALHLNDGAPWRLPEKVVVAEAKSKLHHPLFEQCHGRNNLNQSDAACGFGTSGPVKLLLTGDSHADHLAPTFARLANDRNIRARQLTQNACPPLFGAMRHDPAGKDHCAPYRDALMAYLENHPDLEVVAIGNRWSMYTQEKRIDGNSKIPGRITMGGTDLPSIETSRALLQQHLTGFVDQLVSRGLKVVLVGQVPPHALNPNYCLLRTMRAGRANVDACGIESARAQKHLAYSNQMLQAIAADRPDVYAVLPSAHLCAGRHCKTMLNGEPLYSDYNHLTAGGAAALYDLLPFAALSF